MAELTKTEMEQILFAHGSAEMAFDVERTMETVVPQPHYEYCMLGLAVDGWGAVTEMYRRLLSNNRNRNLQADIRVNTVGQNTLMQEAYVSFDNLKGKRVKGVYLMVIAFDPERRQIIGERSYGDAVWNQMLEEALGADFVNIPGVSKLG